MPAGGAMRSFAAQRTRLGASAQKHAFRKRRERHDLGGPFVITAIQHPCLGAGSFRFRLHNVTHVSPDWDVDPARNPARLTSSLYERGPRVTRSASAVR